MTGNCPATPHLRCHQPAHAQQAHIAGLFLASAVQLNRYGSVVIVRFCVEVELDSYDDRSLSCQQLCYQPVEKRAERHRDVPPNFAGS
jgi:hypothetical protein